MFNKKNLSPLDLAKKFFELGSQGTDRKSWTELLSAECFLHGEELPRVEAWWALMQQDRRYVYVSTAEDGPQEKKYFFQMMIQGKKVSTPKPITVVLESDHWRVKTASV